MTAYAGRFGGVRVGMVGWAGIAVLLLVAGLRAGPARAGETLLDLPPPEDGDAVTGEEETALDRILPKIAERITIGGQVRLRYEYRQPLSYANDLTTVPPTTMTMEGDEVVLLRTRLHLEAAVTDDITAFLQIQDARRFGLPADPDPLADDVGTTDLHQGYLEVRDFLVDWLTIRAGRQHLLYGDQRLVSPLDWGNTGRTFDAVKLRAEPTDGVWVDGFTSWVQDARTANQDRSFSGIYASLTRLEPTVLDGYCFYRHYGGRPIPGRSGPIRDHTIGLRAASRAGGFDGTVEGALQVGNYSTDDTFAYGFAIKGGYTLADLPMSPRLGIEYTHGSGDDDPTDGDHKTFDPLFPFGHFFQGYLDVFSWKNGQDLKGSVTVIPAEGWQAECAVHGLWLTENEDAWYDAGGGVIRQDPSGGHEIGLETDLHAKYKLGEALFLWFGYSHLFPGKYVRKTGRAFDMDWVFFQVGVNF